MDVIGELLRTGLLTQIGEAEDRVGFVRAATATLADRLGSDLRPLVPHALVAGVDESSLSDVEPMFVADEALSAEWSTYRNAFTEPPTEMLRAILVAAIASAAEKDADLLAAGWYALRTAIDFLPASRWQTPLTALVKSWDDAVWETVSESWSPRAASSTVRMPAVAKFTDERIEVSSEARDQAQEFMSQANWQVFAQAMQPGYVDHVNEILAASERAAAESHRRSVETLRSFSAELGNKVRESLMAHERLIDSMRLRSDLLWWQKTAFSPSRRVGYSEMNPVEVSLVAALDLHLLMPNVAPLAAEHLLSELVSKATDNPKVTIDELASVSVEGLPAGSHPVPALILDAIQSGVETPLMARDHEVKAGRIAVLAFRELQARRLTRGRPWSE